MMNCGLIRSVVRINKINALQLLVNVLPYIYESLAPGTRPHVQAGERKTLAGLVPLNSVECTLTPRIRYAASPFSHGTVTRDVIFMNYL
jgi:hypothetical protein